jgi:hypothetical protein
MRGKVQNGVMMKIVMMILSGLLVSANSSVYAQSLTGAEARLKERNITLPSRAGTGRELCERGTGGKSTFHGRQYSMRAVDT